MNNPDVHPLPPSSPGVPQESTEVRWFVPGPIPRRVMSWFRSLAGPPLREEARTDLYLVPTDPGMGVKVRSGRLELKRRFQSGPTLACGTTVAGQLEQWRKWGFSVAPDEQPEPEAGHWIGIEKRRWTILFGADLNIPAHDEDRPGVIRPGCMLELGAVHLPSGPPSWTICLEAFGGESDRESLLRRVASSTLGRPGGPVLPLEAAFGYPSWILRRLGL